MQAWAKDATDNNLLVAVHRITQHTTCSGHVIRVVKQSHGAELA